MQAAFETDPKDGARAFTMTPTPGKVLFPTADDSKLVGIGPDELSVHVMRPYPGWEEDFRPRIADALAAYADLLTPVGVRRIGLRYINRIALPGAAPDLGAYFTIPAAPATDEAPTVRAFLSRSESECQDAPVRVLLTFASVNTSPEASTYLLDIDVVRDWTDAPLQVPDTMPALDDLRRRERNVFEQAIKDKTRELFDAA
jgi:uncharacterized protein (TIGR04255 family)